MENSLFQFNGDVTIGTAIAEAGIVDASIGKTIVNQNLRPELPSQATPAAESTQTAAPDEPIIRLKKPLSKKAGLKSNLIRVIGALYVADYFVDAKGGRPTQKDVFNAFSKMLGEDLSRYDKPLGKVRDGKNGEQLIDALFSELANAVVTFCMKEEK